MSTFWTSDVPNSPSLETEFVVPEWCGTSETTCSESVIWVCPASGDVVSCDSSTMEPRT